MEQSTEPTMADWEKAAELLMKPDDWQDLRSLAEAFAHDRRAGVDSRLVPASSPPKP